VARDTTSFLGATGGRFGINNEMCGYGPLDVRSDVRWHRRHVFVSHPEPAATGAWCRQAQAVPGEPSRSRFDLHLLFSSRKHLVHPSQSVWEADLVAVQPIRWEGLRVVSRSHTTADLRTLMTRRRTQ
jgi:hypothetical protein